MSEPRVWQVRLPDGSVWIPEDSRPGDPRASWIYARSTADDFARKVGGRVVAVTRRQKDKLLDQEIASALGDPAPLKSKSPRTRTRAFSRTARRAIGEAVLASVPLPPSARSALGVARETADAAEYRSALGALAAALPPGLWATYDDRRDAALVQIAEPVWATDDPQGEDPAKWQRIAREDVAQMLVEDA